MVGGQAGRGWREVKYAHCQVSKQVASPGRGALGAVLLGVRECWSRGTACAHQPDGRDGAGECYSDSDHAGNAELQNKRRSQLGYIAMSDRVRKQGQFCDLRVAAGWGYEPSPGVSPGRE